MDGDGAGDWERGDCADDAEGGPLDQADFVGSGGGFFVPDVEGLLIEFSRVRGVIFGEFLIWISWSRVRSVVKERPASRRGSR